MKVAIVAFLLMLVVLGAIGAEEMLEEDGELCIDSLHSTLVTYRTPQKQRLIIFKMIKMLFHSTK